MGFMGFCRVIFKDYCRALGVIETLPHFNLSVVKIPEYSYSRRIQMDTKKSKTYFAHHAHLHRIARITTYRNTVFRLESFGAR